MSVTDRFTQQHHEIISLCNHLVECSIEKYISNDASFVHNLQTSLFKVLDLHLKLEDTALYPMLHEHKNPSVRATSLRLKDEFLSCAHIYTLYQKNYSTTGDIEVSSAQYVKDTQYLVKMIRSRINKEERELYSLLR